MKVFTEDDGTEVEEYIFMEFSPAQNIFIITTRDNITPEDIETVPKGIRVLTFFIVYSKIKMS